MTRDERKRLDALLAAYPGVTYRADDTRRHERVVLHHSPNLVAVVVKSKSPSCPRATDNFLGDVRRALKGFKP